MLIKFLDKVLVCLAVGGIAFADNYAVVDGGRLISEIKEVKSIELVLRNEFAARENELKEKTDELRLLVKQAERDSSVMTKSEQIESKRKLVKLDTEIKQLSAALEEDFHIRTEEKMNALKLKVANFIELYAKEKNLDIIFYKESLLFNKDNLNITDDLIAEFEKYKG